MKCLSTLFLLFTTTFLFAQDAPLDTIPQFTVIEVVPEYPGGFDAMNAFVAKNMKYPAIARENGIAGVVVINFAVDSSGFIKNATIAEDIGGGCGAEALRIVNAMPQWTPGYSNGEAVEVMYNMPFTFSLATNHGLESFTFIKRYTDKDIDWPSTTSGFFLLNSGYSFYTGEVSELLSHEVNYLGFGVDVQYAKRLNMEFDISFRQSFVRVPFVHEGIDIPNGDKLWTNEVYFGGGYNLINTHWFNLNSAAGLSIKNLLPNNDLIPEGQTFKNLYRPSVGLGMDFKLIKYAFGRENVVQQVRYPVIRLYSRFMPFKISDQKGGNLHIGLGLSMGFSNLEN